MTEAAFEALLSALSPGASVFVQGAVGEPQAFIDALVAHPERARDVRFTAPLIPGINRFDYAGVHPQAHLTAFMSAPSLARTAAEGRTRVLPLSYAQTARRLREARFDVAVVQLTPPDASGLCSFGVSGDFAPLVWRRARRRVAIINSQMVRPPRSETAPLSAFHVTVEVDAPLRTLSGGTGDRDPVLQSVARRAASLVPDAAAVQTGIGGAPAAVLGHLSDRRGLRIRSGMIIEAHRALFQAGALDPEPVHTAGIAYGDQSFYEWTAQSDVFAFERVSLTHSVPRLSRTPGFIAVNSALEIDLFGQANLEWRGDQAVSGVGGAPDFARSAALSRGGISIIALPASAGEISRIVPQLSGPTVSLARHEVDVVVTEHGIAWLRDKGMDERAEALTAIADPRFRSGLKDAWRDRGGKSA